MARRHRLLTPPSRQKENPHESTREAGGPLADRSPRGHRLRRRGRSSRARPATAAHVDLDLQRGSPEVVQRDRRRVPQVPPAGRRDHLRPHPFRELHDHPDHADRRRQRPDLAWILENSAPDFVGSGALVPLKSKIENAGELVPAATRLWERDGELYAYPFSTSPFGVFVNTDLVKAAGQKMPRELMKAGQWDWQHANEINKAVAAKGKNGLTILNFDYKAWDNLATVWQGWGAKAWSDDGGTCQFNAPEMVEAMTFLHKAIFTDKSMPGPGTAVDFFSGDTAMAVAQISRAAMLEDATFKWDLVPLPAGPKGEYAVIGQAGIGVLKKSPRAEQATDFLTYFTNAANSAKLAAYFPPARGSLLTADTMAKTSPMLNGDQLQEVVVDGIQKGVVKPSHTGQAELAQTARAALDPLWKPDADVKAVLDGVCAKIQPLLGG
ncbi:extracellular solute-binding protein [Nonomuraea recticatena]|uniref:extracellular solute-binding protein n=1 Tax=Nonomuraea recticatena TaxID=46178 RepID=UPI0036195B6F